MLNIDIYNYSPSGEHTTKHQKQDSTNEIEINTRLILNFFHLINGNSQNPYLVTYIDFIIKDTKFIFISESFGVSFRENLELKRKTKSFYSISEIISITHQLLSCINSLEKEGIVWTCLQPDNVLINEKNKIKLKNYFINELFDEFGDTDHWYKLIYLPPEAVLFNNLKRKKICSSVIWSIGVIVLEMLMDIGLFTYFQVFLDFLKNGDYSESYVECIKNHKEESVYILGNEGLKYNTSDKNEMFTYFLNGGFIPNKLKWEKESPWWIDFIKTCLTVNCDKRQSTKALWNHGVFKNCLDKTPWVNWSILPVDKETLKQNAVKNWQPSPEDSFLSANSADNYLIVTRILQVDIHTYWWDNDVIHSTPWVFSIPTYFSLAPNTFYWNNLNSNNNEDSNEEIEKSLSFITSHCLELPIDYYKNPASIEILLNRLNICSKENFENSATTIKYYFAIKNIIASVLYNLSEHHRENLLSEIKKAMSTFTSLNDILIPSTYRTLAYCILLNIDYFNDRDSLVLPNCYPISSQNDPQITKAWAGSLKKWSCDNAYFPLVQCLIAATKNIKNFFFVQGMEMIWINIYTLTRYNLDITYKIFTSFVLKFLIQFYSLDTRIVKDLKFNHLVIQRLLAFYDPEWYKYLSFQDLFSVWYATNLFLTLFSLTFKGESLYIIWDLLLIENTNIIYIIIINILLVQRDTLFTLKLDEIQNTLKNYASDKDIPIHWWIRNSINMYKEIPSSWIPWVHEFNYDVVEDLKKNDFFKSRWWDTVDFFSEEYEYKVPIITWEDVVKCYENIIFVDVREWDEGVDQCYARVKDAIIWTRKNLEEVIRKLRSVSEGKEERRIVVLIGNKNTNYREVVKEFINDKVKYLTVLQGGIDIIQWDEPSLII